VSDSDNRSHPRAPIELKISYQRVNAFFADYTKDISKGGIFIKTDTPLDLGTEFEFQVTLPGEPQALRLIGRVEWISRGEDRSKSAHKGMGISFVWSSDNQRQEFEKVVEQLMLKTLGGPLYKKLLDKAKDGKA